MVRWVRVVCLSVLLCILPYFAATADAAGADAVRVSLPYEGGETFLQPTILNEESWLFLPAFAQKTVVWQNAHALETQISSVDSHVQMWRLWQDGKEIGSLNVMQGDQLRALFLFSDDPVHRGRNWVEAGENHQNTAQASMILISADGNVDHAGRVKQIRGRGNGSWGHEKRPYQIKLTDAVNLLETDNADEASQTWVLLAEATDTTLLHNRIAMDLALESDLTETSRSEFVDLYYDGEYRGVYLLAEKVEIGPGRVDEVDYDKLINSWNRRVGKKVLDVLPVEQAQNRYGNHYTYIQGVGELEEPGSGAFLLEVENPKYTLSDRCWFELSNGVIIASKSPENASERMMAYISEKLESALRTLQNGGVNPETGRMTAQEFDLESFARLALVSELAYNIDAFTYSSTWFVLPAGEQQFRAGPVWDYDLAWRYLLDGSNQDAQGLKKNEGWALALYSDPMFVDCMRRIWIEEMAPLVQNVLLGSTHGKYLQPLNYYHDQIESSRRMNEKRWTTARDKRLVYGSTMQEEKELLERFIRQRSGWLTERFEESWTTEKLELTFRTGYGFADSLMKLEELPWPHVMPVLECTQLTPATEESYARWKVDVTLSLADWSMLKSSSVMVNGTELPFEILSDGRLHFAFAFEDISYRPVMYNGMDVGWIYDYDFYTRNHPEVIDLCGTDPADVLTYFCKQGMQQGHRGNAYIDAQRILNANNNLWYYFGEEWEKYYWEYLYNGREELWLKRSDNTYQPVIEQVQ